MKIKANQTTKSETERINNSIKDRTTFFYYAFRNILLVGLPLLVISGFILSHLSFSSSATSGSGSSADSLNISISSSCTLGSVVNNAHNTEVFNGNYKDNIGKTTITTLCNDNNGYAIYAIGYTNDEEGNNKLINSSSPQNSIETGLSTSGLTSAWAMRLDYIENDPSPTPPTSITSNYNATYGLVPSYYTKVVEKASGTTDMSQGSSFTTTYAVYASSNQYAGTYTGQVKYLLTHPSTTADHFFMQDVAEWKNSILPNPGDSIQAIDQRDGKAYWATRLADGNVWMTQNLDFDIDSTKTYTHWDTDLGWSTMDENATWTPSSTNGKYNIPWNGTSFNGFSNQPYYPYSANPGEIYYYTSNSTASDTQYTSLSDCKVAGHTEAECKHYHAGNYYNWTAAIASNNSSNSGTNADTSICPAGWKLPSSSNSDFGNLFYLYDIMQSTTGSSTSYQTDGFNKIRSNPLYFSRSGLVGGSTLYSPGGLGSYWSSTKNGSASAYYLFFSSSSIQPSNGDGRTRGDGMSIRCLAR